MTEERHGQRLYPGESYDEYFQRRKKERTEENTTLQRRRMMTEDEKRRGAVEKMARDLKSGAEKAGQYVSYDSAHKEAVRIAEQTFRKHDK